MCNRGFKTESMSIKSKMCLTTHRRKKLRVQGDMQQIKELVRGLAQDQNRDIASCEGTAEGRGGEEVSQG